MKNKVNIKIDWDGHNYASCPVNEDIACVVTAKTLDGVKSEMTDALHQHINWMKKDGDDIPEEFLGEWEIEWVLTASAQLQYAETFKGTPEGMPYRPLNV